MILFSKMSLINADSSHNDGEKTFAIIVGLLAGVALLIIFLTFMRKVFEGSGKFLCLFSFLFGPSFNYLF